MTMDGRSRWLALIVLCLGDLMIVLDSTIVNVALPSIRDDLGFTQESLAWVVNAYLSPSAVSCSSAGASAISSGSGGCF
jgi:MFS family permease